ncbi:Gag polyprotein [Lonchura striata]|uniref:Gag polyprotein n=2 Tax=Lonchura striata TaxID=40157 RepID=A0A218UT48_9PASE|nr:Gag polyprotein [Lonchura striata domestica]
MKTQNADWDDIQVILDTLMDSTEKEMVLKAAKEKARQDIINRLVMGTLDDNFPTKDPGWDPNVSGHVQRLKKYQEWVQIGVQHAVPKTINWSKLYEIRQEKKESPTVFLERLKEAVRKYTDLQIDAPQAKVQIALIFLGQSQDDIRRKLQKLEGEELRNLDKLLEVAWKVYNNREKEISKRQQQNLLVVIQGKGNPGIRGRGRGGCGLGRGGGFGRGHGRTAVPKLGFNQCAFCMQGHWENECPNQFYQGNQPSQDQDTAKLMVLGKCSN